MKHNYKKILESKKKIREEKLKIRKEKRSIRKKKYNKFFNTKFGKFFKKTFSFIRLDKDTYSFSEVLVITLCSLVIGALSCFSVFMIISDGKNYFKNYRELDKFVEVYDTLLNNYYGEINKEELVDEAIKGMVTSVGDDYTNYVGAEGTNDFDELVSGVYEGVGCTIKPSEKGVIVFEVFEDSPAFNGGLMPGDIIIKLDGKDATKMDTEEVSSYIKNSKTNKVKLVVLRNDEELEISLTRARVETPVVTSNMYEKNGKKIGYLKISIFSSVADKQFEKKLIELEEDGIDSLVIDVRDNNGGYLTTVTDIASLLLPKGKIIYQVEKGDKKDIAKDKTITSRNYPIAILTNGSSASASEILASVIKESYGGYVVGTKTYGKGTVQQTKKLTDGSMIKYTIEKWLTPDGNWIDEVGLEPTHEIILTEDYYNESIAENDSQLQKALELVSE